MIQAIIIASICALVGAVCYTIQSPDPFYATLGVVFLMWFISLFK